MTPAFRSALRMTHSYRNDGEPGDPQCLSQRLKYSWRREIAQTCLAVARDYWLGNRPSYVPESAEELEAARRLK